MPQGICVLSSYDDTIHHVAECGEVLVTAEAAIPLDVPASVGDGEAFLHALADQAIVFLNRPVDQVGVCRRAASPLLGDDTEELARECVDCPAVKPIMSVIAKLPEITACKNRRPIGFTDRHST